MTNLGVVSEMGHIVEFNTVHLQITKILLKPIWMVQDRCQAIQCSNLLVGPKCCGGDVLQTF